jgi:hypothetical protein
MNPLNLFNMLPLIMQAMRIASQIQEAVRTGKSVFSILESFGPDLMKMLKAFAETIFPNLSHQDQIQAAAQAAFDQASIKFAQETCNKLGLAEPALVTDGIMGLKTKAAVEAFQKKYKVEVDGWPGPLTQAAMQQALATVK